MKFNKYRHNIWDNNLQRTSSRSKFYSIWAGMKARCYNKNHIRYKDYGGRGITVCKKWQTFINFRDDMYDEYANHVNQYGNNNTSLDRINNNKSYSKSNCRWVTYAIQNQNSRQVKLITYNGKTQSIKSWSAELNINYQTLCTRLNEAKLSPVEALKPYNLKTRKEFA